MTTKQYVVTGGAGFIGSHIAARLIQDGHAVRIVDNFLTGKRENIALLESLNGDMTLHETSILNEASLRPIFEGADTVFHQAALPSVQLSVEDPASTHAHCATGTLHVLKAAKDAGVRRVVYAASSAAYGSNDHVVQIETYTPAPLSPYGVAKLTGEYYCQSFYQVYGLETVALRYFNVFGARQDPNSHYAAVIPKFITLMLQGKTPLIFGDGEQSRDFIHIENVVHGNLLAADAPDAAGEVINLATGKATTVNALVQQLNILMEMQVQPTYAPARDSDILHSCASIEKAERLLNYAPVLTFEEGLARTIAWFKTEAAHKPA
ncbi:MAG: SDR family oxidoreductase [Anaerolineae bacterium]